MQSSALVFVRQSKLIVQLEVSDSQPYLRFVLLGHLAVSDRRTEGRPPVKYKEKNTERAAAKYVPDLKRYDNLHSF